MVGFYLNRDDMNLGGPGGIENKMKPEDYEVQERPSLNSP